MSDQRPNPVKVFNQPPGSATLLAQFTQYKQEYEQAQFAQFQANLCKQVMAQKGSKALAAMLACAQQLVQVDPTSRPWVGRAFEDLTSSAIDSDPAIYPDVDFNKVVKIERSSEKRDFASSNRDWRRPTPYSRRESPLRDNKARYSRDDYSRDYSRESREYRDDGTRFSLNPVKLENCCSYFNGKGCVFTGEKCRKQHRCFRCNSKNHGFSSCK